MIKTKDLERFVHNVNGSFGFSPDESEEYRAEIIKRLQAYDELKNDIENLIKTLDK